MKYIIFIGLFFMVHNLSAQCDNFYQQGCELPINWPYEFDSQSISAGMLPGQAFRIKAVFYEGSDYYIGFCKEESTPSYSFKLNISGNEITMDDATEENSNLKYIELTMQETMIVVIEIKVNRTQTTNYSQSDVSCLGIIIGNKESEQTY